MAESLQNLGQQAPAATTLTALYTVPSATSAVCSTITICNQNSTTIQYRISIAVAGAADTPSQYIAYNASCLGYGFVTLTLGITLAATDVIRVYSNTANVSFGAWGSVIT